MQVMSNLHTHTLYSHTRVKCFVWGCKVFGLIWEGRKKGESMDHMITLESLESIL